MSNVAILLTFWLSCNGAPVKAVKTPFNFHPPTIALTGLEPGPLLVGAKGQIVNERQFEILGVIEAQRAVVQMTCTLAAWPRKAGN